MFARAPQPSCVTRNPFIVLRFVLFAILVYVNLLTIGFATWNLTVLKGLGDQALGAPGFVLFNACILLTLLGMCLISAWYSLAAFDKVRNECVWTGSMSVLQLASSMDITVSGPPTLCSGVSILACASSSLTVALSWVSSTMLLLYSFSLLTTAISHMHEVPDVWTASVRTVAWFAVPSASVESPPPRSSTEKPRLFDSDDVFVEDAKRASPLHFPTPIFAQHAKALPLSPQSAPESSVAAAPPIWHAARRRSSVPSLDFPPPPSKRTTWTSRMFSGVPSLAHKCSTESVRPTWAKTAGSAAGRRGVDHPFALPRPGGPAPGLKPLVLPTIRPLRTMKSCWSASTGGSQSHPPPPALPPKARMPVRLSNAGAADPASGLSPTSTFYIDLERDAVVSVGAPSLGRPLSYDMFPEDVVDPDAPVTRSQPSTWVRAHSPASSTSASR
ncbi:hypothetical protein TRAPUB_8838 [Trametes pubescens]|uniref:Uncharacterized protein n=1 Tax=Trametes pubescens TaxID=154538 RepID=A0A1M2W4A0_TRAPU|nr:hypothetical protein TRAPUB_8838 [Trametes pubescens]